MHQVDSVSVLRIPWTADRYAVNDDIPAPLGDEVEFRRILDRNSGNQHAVAVREPDQVRPKPFLFLRRGRGIIEVLKPERVPERIVFANRSAEAQEVFPLNITDLAPFDSPPPFSVSVQDTLSGYADILAFAGRESRDHSGTVRFQEGGFFGRKENECVTLQMQINIVFEGDRSCQVDPCRNEKVPSSLFSQRGDGFPKSLGIERDAVSGAAEIKERDRPVGDDGSDRLRKSDGQIPV